MRIGPKIWGVLAGSVLTIGIFRFLAASKTESVVPLGIFVTALFIMGIYWGRSAKTGDMSLPKGLLSGVAAGWAIDVTYGYAVAHEDRGLAGVEILIYLVPAAIAILLGTVVGRRFRRFA
jgi:hypothetical protein